MLWSSPRPAPLYVAALSPLGSPEPEGKFPENLLYPPSPARSQAHSVGTPQMLHGDRVLGPTALRGSPWPCVELVAIPWTKERGEVCFQHPAPLPTPAANFCATLGPSGTSFSIPFFSTKALLEAEGYSREAMSFTGSRAKWKCRSSYSKMIKNLKMVTAEHRTHRRGPNCTSPRPVNTALVTIVALRPLHVTCYWGLDFSRTVLILNCLDLSPAPPPPQTN